MKNRHNNRIITIFLLCLMLFALTSCYGESEQAESSSSGYSNVNIDTRFDHTAPQYYMNKNTAASKDGYYYVANEVVSAESGRYLYFYDTTSHEEYPLCSKLTCEHNDETCDAHIIIDNIFNGGIWYYENRLYMVEKTEEYDHIISYDLNGRDRQEHTVLTVEGASLAEFNMSTTLCFNEGYVYYMTIKGLNTSLYKAGIAKDSVPELVKTYNFSEGYPMINLTAMPGRVYVNYTVKDTGTLVSSHILDSYDIQSGKLTEVMRTDSEENPGLLSWQNVLFDDKHNMYYATATETEYIVNKLYIDSKITEKFYSIECDNTTLTDGFVGGQTEAEFISLCNFDGEYIYIFKSVGGLNKVEDFKEITINYGTDKSKAFKTKINTNYLFVIDRAGNCVNIFPFKQGGLKESSSRLQGMLSPRYLFGDYRYLFISFSGSGMGFEKIEGLEITNEKYLNELEELRKAISKNPQDNSFYVVSVRAVLKKHQLNQDVYNWEVLGNEYNYTGSYLGK